MNRHISFLVKLLQVVLLFGVFYTYAMFQGGFVSWFLFYSFLPLILYMFLLLIYPISKWTISRNLSKQVVQAGDDIQVEIEITRKFIFPLYYVIVEELFPTSLHKKDIKRNKYKYINQLDGMMEKRIVKKVSFPWFKRTMRYSYAINNIPRGEHRLQALRVTTGDFFGFIKKDFVYQTSNDILAYPSSRRVAIKERVNSFYEGASPSHTINLKNTNVVSSVREYTPGDRLSWIDWKTTARKNTVMTKEFEQEKSSNILLILDANDYQGFNKIAFEAQIELTTSIMETFKNKSAPFAFLSLGQEQVFFPYKQDPVRNVMNTFLAKLEPGGQVPFPQKLMEQAKKMPYGVITLLVITYLNQDMKQSIDSLKQKSERIVIYLIKPSSNLSELDEQTIQRLSAEGVVVNVLTEEQLIKREFEVNM